MALSEKLALEEIICLSQDRLFTDSTITLSKMVCRRCAKSSHPLNLPAQFLMTSYLQYKITEWTVLQFCIEQYSQTFFSCDNNFVRDQPHGLVVRVRDY